MLTKMTGMRRSFVYAMKSKRRLSSNGSLNWLKLIPSQLPALRDNLIHQPVDYLLRQHCLLVLSFIPITKQAVHIATCNSFDI